MILSHVLSPAGPIHLQGGRRRAGPGPGSSLTEVLIGGAILVALVFLVVFLRYASLWIRSLSTGAGIGLFEMVVMSLRKVKPATILEAKSMAVQAGLTSIRTSDLEAHYRAGGDVTKVISALIAADRARIGLDFQQACAKDLSTGGRRAASPA